eukprot:3862555-Rhodomonas_salina.1
MGTTLSHILSQSSTLSAHGIVCEQAYAGCGVDHAVSAVDGAGSSLRSDLETASSLETAAALPANPPLLSSFAAHRPVLVWEGGRQFWVGNPERDSSRSCEEKAHGEGSCAAVRAKECGGGVSLTAMAADESVEHDADCDVCCVALCARPAVMRSGLLFSRFKQVRGRIVGSGMQSLRF